MGKFSLRNLFNPGIKEEIFNSRQFKTEVMAYASWKWENGKKSYEDTRKQLDQLKLNEKQKDTVISWLKEWHRLEAENEVFELLVKEVQLLINQQQNQQAFNIAFAAFESNKQNLKFLGLLIDVSDTYKTQEGVIAQIEKLKLLMKDQEYNVEYRKALYLKGKGRYEEATVIFNELNQQHEFAWNYYQMAIMENLKGNTDASLALLEKTFAMEPDLRGDAKGYPELQNLFGNRRFIYLTT